MAGRWIAPRRRQQHFSLLLLGQRRRQPIGARPDCDRGHWTSPRGARLPAPNPTARNAFRDAQLRKNQTAPRQKTQTHTQKQKRKQKRKTQRLRSAAAAALATSAWPSTSSPTTTGSTCTASSRSWGRRSSQSRRTSRSGFTARKKGGKKEEEATIQETRLLRRRPCVPRPSPGAGRQPKRAAADRAAPRVSSLALQSARARPTPMRLLPPPPPSRPSIIAVNARDARPRRKNGHRRTTPPSVADTLFPLPRRPRLPPAL